MSGDQKMQRQQHSSISPNTRCVIMKLLDSQGRGDTPSATMIIGLSTAALWVFITLAPTSHNVKVNLDNDVFNNSFYIFCHICLQCHVTLNQSVKIECESTMIRKMHFFKPEESH